MRVLTPIGSNPDKPGELMTQALVGENVTRRICRWNLPMEFADDGDEPDFRD